MYKSEGSYMIHMREHVELNKHCGCVSLAIEYF